MVASENQPKIASAFFSAAQAPVIAEAESANAEPLAASQPTQIAKVAKSRAPKVAKQDKRAVKVVMPRKAAIALFMEAARREMTVSDLIVSSLKSTSPAIATALAQSGRVQAEAA